MQTNQRPRGQAAAIERATEAHAQAVQAFGKDHPAVATAEYLVAELTAASDAAIAAEAAKQREALAAAARAKLTPEELAAVTGAAQ